jgi:NADH-quinone oxidoreductase subunit H
MTEYSSIKFLLYMLSEYVAMVSMSGIMVTMFLGGWRAPWPITAFWPGANDGWWPLLWFVAKIVLMLFVFVWVRATLPRLRYDQFMRLGWKVLLPVNLLWILALSGIRVAQAESLGEGKRWMIFGGIVVVVILVALLWPSKRPGQLGAMDEQLAERPPGSFPLPPLDLQVPPSPRALRVLAERQPANVSAESAPGDDGPARDRQV